MADTSELLASGVGLGAGVGTTVLMRQQFDQTGETTILRPSVLWGLGTGVAAMVAPMFMPSLKRGMVGEIVEDYGEAAIVSGAFSALNPKGSSSVQLPTV